MITFNKKTEGADFKWSAEGMNYSCSGTFVRESESKALVSLMLTVSTKDTELRRGGATIYSGGIPKYNVADVESEDEANSVIAAAAACIAELSTEEIVTE